MKIAIMTDMEGSAGIINFHDWCEPTGRYYEEGKKLLTEEVNAAVRGFFDAGADEVVVIDGHGAGGINPILLDERAQYSRIWAHPYIYGLDDGFDAIAWVGQHAKAGTLKSHISHTGWFNVLDQQLNGISVGEFGFDAAVAGSFGVSAIFAAGERAFTEEAKALIPNVHTAEVKYGVTLDNGADLTTEQYMEHNLGAVHVHPTVARQRIYEGAKAALKDFIVNPNKFKPFCPEPPYVLEIWYRPYGEKPAYKSIQRHDSKVFQAALEPAERLEAGTYELPYEKASIEP